MQQSCCLRLSNASARAELSLLARSRYGAKSAMVAAANMVEVAALVGDTARATMLGALMGGKALTGSELAFLTQISRSTASEHLAKLVNARLIAVTKKRRYRYYRIASPLVARMLESIKTVAAIEAPPRYQPRSMQDERLRFARTCYDHLAGRLGVAIADALIAKKYVVLTEDGGEMTDSGARFLARVRRGIDIEVWQPANVLPAVPRLERTPVSRRGSRRRRDFAAQSGAWLVETGPRYAGGADYAERTNWLARHVRHKPEPQLPWFPKS